MPIGCASIELQNNQAREYLSMRLSTSNKGWHSQWFYLKYAAAAPLLEFIGRLIEEAPKQWRKWGIPEKDKKKILDYVAAIRILKELVLNGFGIIGPYHTRRMALLMALLMVRALQLYLVVPGASLEGTTLVEEALLNSEIA